MKQSVAERISSWKGETYRGGMRSSRGKQVEPGAERCPSAEAQLAGGWELIRDVHGFLRGPHVHQFRGVAIDYSSTVD
jgi:hypothetical protein